MFTEDEKRTIRENQLCLDNESMSMKLELLFAENKRLREALEKIKSSELMNGSCIDTKEDDSWRCNPKKFTCPVADKCSWYLAKQALGE